MYKEGASYALFAGKDASRALAKMSFLPEDVNSRNVSDLTEREVTHTSIDRAPTRFLIFDARGKFSQIGPRNSRKRSSILWLGVSPKFILVPRRLITILPLFPLSIQSSTIEINGERSSHTPSATAILLWTLRASSDCPPTPQRYDRTMSLSAVRLAELDFAP